MKILWMILLIFSKTIRILSNKASQRSGILWYPYKYIFKNSAKERIFETHIASFLIKDIEPTTARMHSSTTTLSFLLIFSVVAIEGLGMIFFSCLSTRDCMVIFVWWGYEQMNPVLEICTEGKIWCCQGQSLDLKSFGIQ